MLGILDHIQPIKDKDLLQDSLVILIQIKQMKSH